MTRWTQIVAALLIFTCGCSLVPAATQIVTAKIEKDQVVVDVDGKLWYINGLY